ncbi:MAG: glycosyltransferase family 2 protein [Deltaproteobacteria bacterium]|nr:glycosyltransferase family 2 protein [Deltaproteobacteria bacterium]
MVVPALNEAAHVRSVLQRMPPFVDQIFVVDDQSTDDTAVVAASCGDARVTVIRHPSRQGVGGAMVTGMRRALSEGADLIVKVDGDGQMDPEQIAALIEPLTRDGYDYAKGNRFLHGNALRQMPRPRLFGNFALTFLTKLASGYWHIFDPQNGFLAVRASALRGIDLDSVAHGFFFENDMLIRLNILNCRVKDVAIPALYGSEESSLRIRRVLVTFPTLLLRGLCMRIWEKYMLRDFSAIAVFWLVGIPLIVFGGTFGAWHWAQSWWTGHPASTGTVMLSVLPFLIGFELILQAIILEIRESPR